MTQRSVEILIGKLLTDEELRESFQRDPQAILLQLRNQGLELSSLELQALSSIGPAEVSDLAEVIDPRG
jgi:hypothetical protein